MRKGISAGYDHVSLLELLDIPSHVQSRLREYGDVGENAFDVYTLYKSAAKRKCSDIVESNDILDMRCLAWMTKNDFMEAKRLLRRLGYITEIVDQGRSEIRFIKIMHHKNAVQKNSGFFSGPAMQ